MLYLVFIDQYLDTVKSVKVFANFKQMNYE